MNFNWEEFINKETIWVHCKTKEESLDFIKNGYKHRVALITSHNKIWETTKGEGVYYIISHNQLQGKFTLPTTYKIIEWSDYMEKENKEEKTIWKQIAEYLGIKIDEEFELENDEERLKYRINGREGLQYKCKDWYYSQCLNKLLTGELKIRREPEFKVGDKFIIPEFTVKKININKRNNKTITYENVEAEILHVLKNDDKILYQVKVDDVTIFNSEEQLRQYKRI